MAYVDSLIGYTTVGLVDPPPPTYVPALTVFTDADPSPRCLVVFTTLAAGTQTINVYKVVEGRTYEVRGGLNLFAVGGAQVLDVEPAIGSPTMYRAQMLDAAGQELGWTSPTSVTIDTEDAVSGPNRAWISQPLKPALAVQVTLLVGTAASKVRKSVGDNVWAEGAALATWIGTRRQGLSDLPIKMLCDSPEDADVLQQMFGDYSTDFPSVLCIRSAPPLRIPRILFASTAAPEEIGYASDSVLELDMTVTEVAPPAPGLVLPTLRRMDIDAAYASRAAADAAYATRLQMDTDYSKAGLAG